MSEINKMRELFKGCMWGNKGVGKKLDGILAKMHMGDLKFAYGYYFEKKKYICGIGDKNIRGRVNKWYKKRGV